MTNRIFRRIFIIYAVIVLLAGLFTEIYITSTVRDNHISNLKQHLEDKIGLLSNDISFTKSNLDSFCKKIKEEIHARVTIILNDGSVIGDSDHEAATMDNHANRTEIQQAADLGAGMAIRYSDTLQYDFLYIARKITHGGVDEGFIRLAVPLQEIDRSVNLLRVKIILVVMIVLLVTWGVSVWQTDHLRRLLKQITDFSRSLSRGDIDKRLFLNNAGEFSEIADNLTSMSVALQGMISQSEEERNRLNVILKSVPDALLIIDAKGIVTLSSSSVKDFFGDIPAAGAHFAEVVRNHEFSGLIEEVRKNLLPGMTEFSVETMEEKHLAVRVSPLSYRERDLSGFVAVFHDITDIKKLEQVRKDFVANVSHELKTPITAIKGFADTLLDGALSDHENATRFVQTIKSNSERINALVDDLMTISKIEMGVIKVEKSLIDIEGVSENIMELFKAKAASKNLYIKSHVGQDIGQIEADRNRLIQILTNLVDNAIKFTDTGGVTFGIDREDGKKFIFVEDTGIGVPAKFVSRLGERFFRVDPARSRKMGGTGLGLAIVKHLVKAHGWNMQIESIHGKGTRVKIII
jgi:two-component system, OmpR family, phosphate regulon sensor histidine kinase PhoR